MSSEHIQVRNEGAVRVITFARPDKKNAFTVAMYEAFSAALRDADADAAVRVVLLTGAGDTFSAGNDLGDFMRLPPTDENSAVMVLLRQLADQRKPLVAAVDGVAIGIGTTMLLHADYVAASTRARFALPFVSLGLCPEGGSSLLLPRLVGLQLASEWLMFGEPIEAARAREAGLVNALVAPEELVAFALARAQALAAKPAGALEATKRLLRQPLRDQAKEAIGREAAEFVERLRSSEAAEAFGAFFARKR
jgi:enoyl-CoA hydratase/carnithine racemase